MNNNKSTYIEFEGYEVIKLNMNKITEIENNADENIGFLFKIIPNDKKKFSKANIYQGVKIGASSKFPFEIEVVLKGNFKLGEDSTYDYKINLLKTNASAILFPYLRAIVSLISSQLEYDKIFLPVINFTKIFKDVEIDMLIMEPNQFEDF